VNVTAVRSDVAVDEPDELGELEELDLASVSESFPELSPQAARAESRTTAQSGAAG
jgi:hypothetical protein